MNKTEAENMAAATAQWLHKKGDLGLGKIFSESHLSIPVAEYLIAQGWSDLEAERHSNRLFKKFDKDPVYYDLDAIRKDEARSSIEKLLVEMKFLKIRNDSRLIKDFAKLAFPTNGSGYASLFLIAESTEGPSKSRMIQDLTKSGKCTFQLSLTKGAGEREVRVDLIQGQVMVCSLKKGELKSVCAIMENVPPLREFTVECAANETVGKYRVIIMEVKRQ